MKMQSKLPLILLLLGVLFTMGAKLTRQPIEDFKSVAGEWKGGGVDWEGVHFPAHGTRFPVTLIIEQDGSFEIAAAGIGTRTGFMRIVEERIVYESPFGWGTVVATLYERKGKPILKALNNATGMTWKVKPVRKKKSKKTR